tara:strand:- start:5421 stop:5891 length:471 start_codon:yes stop_codon:yes gene_type:complete
MSENKTSEAAASKRERRKVIDRTKTITGLTLNASIVPTFQNILMTLIAQMKNPEEIAGIYSKINSIEKHIQEEKEIPMELVLNQFEQMIYTCTYLVQYCQEEAEKQGCMVEIESNPLDPEQTKKMFDLILNEKDKSDSEQSQVMKDLVKSLDVKKI